MRWQDLRPSSNVQDIRGMGGRGIALGGGGLGAIVLALIACLMGADPSEILQGVLPGDAQQQQQQQQPGPAANRATGGPSDQNEAFARRVLGSTEDAWREILPAQTRRNYREPVLVLYSGQVSSACGYGATAMGPFYCPGDQKLYLDFDFFQELKNEFRAPGDFAQAYVIAHEVGHHVQNLLGTMAKVQRQGQNNQLSVALELQADCYAGIWANHAQKRGVVEAGDPEEALRAAAAVGDDMIQRRTQGYVVPESFTHGTAQQRQQAFAIGMKSGNMRQCEVFK